MSKPITNYEDKLRGAVHELISAKSALNMEPSPIPESKREPGVPPYLSNTDEWVAHAMEHITVAMDLINEEYVKRGGEPLFVRF